ncbi:RNA polymerase sigma factor [Fusibacter bizertensis]
MQLSFLSLKDIESKNLLEKIYLTYLKEMYYIAYSILNNPHDAQDVVQSAIIKVIPYIKIIDDVKCRKTKYLIATIVKSTAIDLYRKKNNHPLIDIESISDLPDQDLLAIDDIVIKLSEANVITEKLAKLDSKHADILILKYFYEFQDKEIADILRISYTNVRVRINRAKSRLKKLIHNDQFHDENVVKFTEKN